MSISTELKPVVIRNLDIEKVTWARSYCRAAQECGLNVVDEPEGGQNGLFIGDNISKPILEVLALSMYFLAALDLEETEKNNIKNTNVTLLPSSSERDRIIRYFSEIPERKLEVLGFPIDIPKLKRFAIEWDQKIPNSVCFLGDVRPIKNPEMELKIAQALKFLGYPCYHLSPFRNNYKDKLEKQSVIVREGLRGDEYYRLLANFQFVVNTSHRESLFISGIESAILGAIPVLPANSASGYNDWCPSELMYEAGNVDDVIGLIKAVDRSMRTKLKVQQYDQKLYFDKVIKLIGRI